MYKVGFDSGTSLPPLSCCPCTVDGNHFYILMLVQGIYCFNKYPEKNLRYQNVQTVNFWIMIS
jgi:hypothetical protein